MTQLYPDDCDADVYLKKKYSHRKALPVFTKATNVTACRQGAAPSKMRGQAFIYTQSLCIKAPKKSQFDLGSGGFGNITEWAKKIKIKCC